MPETTQDAVVTYPTTLSVDEATAAVERITVEEGFGHIATIDVAKTMRSKGVEFPHEVRVVELCNPHHAKDALSAEMSISAALPCRISVYERDGKTWLSTVRPTVMLQVFGAQEVQGTAEAVGEVIDRIMRRAAG